MTPGPGIIHEVRYNYNVGETPAHIAVRQLHRVDEQAAHKPDATFLAAEINLQEASLYDAANGPLYQAAGAGYKAVTESTLAPLKFQAAWRMAQFPLYRRLYAAREFPTPDQAVKCLNAGLTVANDLRQVIKNRKSHNFQQSGRSKAYGVLAEMSVWGLLMDFSISEGLTNCWIPAQSMIKEDLGEQLAYKTTMYGGVDTNVFIPDDEGAPAIEYKMQVQKSSKIYKPYWPNITKIVVDDELGSSRSTDAGQEIIKDLSNRHGSTVEARNARARTAERIIYLLKKLG